MKAHFSYAILELKKHSQTWLLAMNNLLINLTKNVWNMEKMKWVIFIRSCDLNMAATVKERPYVISYGKTVNLLEVYIIVFI